MEQSEAVERLRRAFGGRLESGDGAVVVDYEAMAAVGCLYRAAGAVRNHFERTVLAEHQLTWTAWVVLLVIWSADEIETRHAAVGAGISKSTLTGVVNTLEGRALVRRRPFPADGRRVLLRLTPLGANLMRTLFPQYNAQEACVLTALTGSEIASLTEALGKIIFKIERSTLFAPGEVVTLPVDRQPAPDH